MSKLYTEEQVRIMLGKARLLNMDDTEMFTDDYLIEQQTPIQLPTDEEIGKGRDENIPIDEKDMWSERFYFNIGAKWMRDKIQGGQDNEN
jgi:hypothetical protein